MVSIDTRKARLQKSGSSSGGGDKESSANFEVLSVDAKILIFPLLFKPMISDLRLRLGQLESSLNTSSTLDEKHREQTGPARQKL